MSLSFILPEVLRELRWWGGSSSCPWGAIGLALVRGNWELDLWIRFRCPDL